MKRSPWPWRPCASIKRVCVTCCGVCSASRGALLRFVCLFSFWNAVTLTLDDELTGASVHFVVEPGLPLRAAATLGAQVSLPGGHSCSSHH